MIMADLIDNGVANGDTAYIYTKGLQMAGCAVLALILGIGSARFSALAGQGLGANIRQAEYEKLQSLSNYKFTLILEYAFPVVLSIHCYNNVLFLTLSTSNTILYIILQTTNTSLYNLHSPQ
jgi:hypothetical protein